MTNTVMTSSLSYNVLPSVTDYWVSSVFWVAWDQGTRFRRKLTEDIRIHHLTNGDDFCDFSHGFNLEYRQLLYRNCISFISVTLSLLTNFKQIHWARPVLVSRNTEK